MEKKQGIQWEIIIWCLVFAALGAKLYQEWDRLRERKHRQDYMKFILDIEAEQK